MTAVVDAVDGADVVLVPGFPLSHPDHEWLVRTLAADGLGRRRIGALRRAAVHAPSRREPQVPAWVSRTRAARRRSSRSRRGSATGSRSGVRSGSYRSQLPLLGMRRSLRRGPHRYALAPEWVAWRPD